MRIYLGPGMIQRFVTSNPSGAYVQAVSDAFKTGKAMGGTIHAPLRQTLNAVQTLSGEPFLTRLPNTLVLLCPRTPPGLYHQQPLSTNHQPFLSTGETLVSHSRTNH